MSETSFIPLPEIFSQPLELAHEIYKFWSNSMIADDVISLVPPEFSQLETEERLHLIEAIQVVVTEPLRKFMEQYDFTASPQDVPAPSAGEESSAVAAVMYTLRCYACGNEFYSPMRKLACDRCSR